MAKRYPRRCSECGKVTVQAAQIAHNARIKHDGKLHELHIANLPVDRCLTCGEVFFTNASSDMKSHALRAHLGLLQSEEIRQLLNDRRLTQREFARHLRVAEESVSRWLNGLSIQSRALDTLMRLYFGMPEVRNALSSGDRLAVGSKLEAAAKSTQ